MIKKITYLFLFFLLFPLFVFSQENPVYVGKVDGEIKAGSVVYVERIIEEARKNNAGHIILKLDTPGGLIDSTKKIVDLIEESEIDFSVYIYKSGGWAYSAGSFILLSADYAFAHPESSIGAAEPRAITGEAIEDDGKMKLAMASWMKSIATANNRNPKIAEKFVTENLAISGKEALKKGLIDGNFENIENLINEIGFSDKPIIKANPNLIETFFNTLSHPYLVSLFLSLGMIALVFAFRTGELEVSGVLGLVFLAIGLWGIGVINFSVLGLIFLAIGVILLGVEVFGDPGFGIMGGLGVILMGVGVFGFGNEPLLFPEFFDFVTLFVLGILVSLFVIFIVIGKGAIKAFKKAPVIGVEAIIGERGEVVKKIDPLGVVKIENISWSAKSFNDKKIEIGNSVRVIGIEGNTVIVKKEDEDK